MSEQQTDGHRKTPGTWGSVQVGDICDAINGRAFKSSEWRTSGIPIVRIENLKDAEASHNYFLGPLEEKHRVRRGDLLFAWSGTPGTSFGAHVWRGDDAALNQHIFKILFNADVVTSSFLVHALNQNVAGYVKQAHGGVGLAHITKSRFIASRLPIPPLPEQHRIVAAIESYFTRLDDAVATLERVQKNLKRYRASVLKAAVEGRLVPTEAELARTERRDYEPASVLLERIRAERRRGWEATGRKGKYKDLVALDTTDLRELPEGWGWSTISGIASLVTDGDHNPPRRVERGVPHLTARHIKNGVVTFERCSYVSAEGFEQTRLRYEPQGGDVIVTCVGTVGEVAVVPLGCVFSADRNLAAIRTVPEGLLPKFLAAVLTSPAVRTTLKAASGSTAQPHLYLDDLRAVAIPLPPKAEQARIVEEVGRLLTISDAVDAEIGHQVMRCARLRQSIVKWAFGGNLADQDPNDEPASVLLERIKSEASAAPTKVSRPSNARARKTA